MNIDNIILNIESEVIELRRKFHSHPEKSWNEYNTQKRIIEYLEKCDVPYRTVEKTGVIAWLMSENNSKTIGLRADIDALEMEENTDLPFKSKNQGIMHSCGHDTHIAMLLGACNVLSQIRDKLRVNVVFIFQPAEEFISDSGAAYLKNEAEVLECDQITAIHMWPDIEAGYVALREGPVMASADTFKITIKGKGGHGAMIHENINPIIAGTYLVNALEHLVSLEYDSQESAVISVTSFQSGQTSNITPEIAIIQGTTRSFNPEISGTFEKKISRVIKGVELTTNTNIDLEYNVGPPVMINDKEVVDIANVSLSKVFEKNHIIKNYKKQMGGEDFAKYKAKKAIIFLGGGYKDKERRFPLHSPNFDIDESVLKNGVSYFVNFVLAYQDFL